MSATNYKVDLRDQHFVLFEQVRVQDLNSDKFADYDQDVYEMILDEARKMAEDSLAPLNQPGDRQGCSWSDGKVTTPDGYKEAYAKFCETGWGTVTTPVEDGGQGLPMPMAIAINEIFTGACCAFMM